MQISSWIFPWNFSYPIYIKVPRSCGFFILQTAMLVIQYVGKDATSQFHPHKNTFYKDSSQFDQKKVLKNLSAYTFKVHFLPHLFIIMLCPFSVDTYLLPLRYWCFVLNLIFFLLLIHTLHIALSSNSDFERFVVFAELVCGSILGVGHTLMSC